MKYSEKPNLNEVIELMDKITEDANSKLIAFRARYNLKESDCGFASKENGTVFMYLDTEKITS